jgi:hypothetical protein
MRGRVFCVAVLLAVVGCRDGAVDPSGESGATRLDAARITLTALGDSARVTASFAGQATTSPELAVTAESRYLHDWAVLDPEQLRSGRIVALAPGVAQLAVRAFGNPPVSLEVRVLPPGPLVMEAVMPPVVGDGDTLLLRGYRLHQVDPAGLRVGADVPEILERDSANLWLALASATPQSCAGSSPRDSLRIPDALLRTGVVVRRRRAGDVVLGAGEARRLPAGSGCLRLAAQPGAAYALAYLDLRALQSAVSGPERSDVADRTGPASTAASWGAGAPQPAGTAPPAVAGVQHARAAGPAGSPADRSGRSAQGWPQAARDNEHARIVAFGADSLEALTERATPWVLGETFTWGTADRGFNTARVVRIYDGHFVLALVLADSVPQFPAWLARMDSIMPLVLAEALPLLQAAFLPGRPTTSPGSGQHLIIARRLNFAGGVAAPMTIPGDAGVYSFVALDIGGGDAHSLLHLVTHELAHAYQYMYAWDSRPSGETRVTLGERWAVEGGANLLANEVIRRRFGIGLEDNWDWRPHSPGSPLGPYAAPARVQDGTFAQGYDRSAMFLQELVIRGRRAWGETYEATLAAVARGALEGWYGFDAAGNQRYGLTAAMRDLYGVTWEPDERLLIHALSQAVDDMFASTTFQNPAYREVSQGPGRLGWKPDALLAAGSADSHTALREQGSLGYFYLDDDDLGASFALTTAVPDIAWMLVRYR